MGDDKNPQDDKDREKPTPIPIKRVDVLVDPPFGEQTDEDQAPPSPLKPSPGIF